MPDGGVRRGNADAQPDALALTDVQPYALSLIDAYPNFGALHWGHL